MTTCAKCHEEPACAEYQTIVPNPNTSVSTIRGNRATPMPRITTEARPTLTAPSRTDAQPWLVNWSPKTATGGIRTIAGIGG